MVAGDIGTGTSTLAKGLAKKLGWKYLSVGDYFRNYHNEHNIPLWSTNTIPEDLDKKIDKEFVEKIKREEKIILDSHFTSWFVKDLKYIFKILLVADSRVSTKRIVEREHTQQETPEEIEKRRKELKEKFEKLYSSDNYEDPKIFDLVINTTNTGQTETLERAYEVLKKGY